MPEFLTERQFTQNSPKWICRALKNYRHEGGEETLFLRGVYFMQIMAMLAPDGFLKGEDYRVELEASYQAEEWSVWHLRLLEEFHYFIRGSRWVFLQRKYRTIQRRLGLKFLWVRNWLVAELATGIGRIIGFFSSNKSETAIEISDSG